MANSVADAAIVILDADIPGPRLRGYWGAAVCSSMKRAPCWRTPDGAPGVRVPFRAFG